MEKKLRQLFDYQKFAENRELQSVIDSVHAKYAKRELNFDEMEMVSAAGVPQLPNKNKDGEE